MAQGGGALAEVAQTFGVDWPHSAPRSISFGIVCAVLYALAYRPILKMLETRRSQIAAGLANAEKIRAELARIESDRQGILAKAGGEGKQLIEEARAAAAKVRVVGNEKATLEAEQIIARAHESAARDHARMLAELKREVGRLVVQTTASVTGKVLTPDTIGGSRKIPRRSWPPRKCDEDEPPIAAPGAATV